MSRDVRAPSGYLSTATQPRPAVVHHAHAEAERPPARRPGRCAPSPGCRACAVHVGAAQQVDRQLVHRPLRRKRSASASRRAVAIISAKARSAVASVEYARRVGGRRRARCKRLRRCCCSPPSSGTPRAAGGGRRASGSLIGSPAVHSRPALPIQPLGQLGRASTRHCRVGLDHEVLAGSLSSTSGNTACATSTAGRVTGALTSIRRRHRRGRCGAECPQLGRAAGVETDQRQHDEEADHVGQRPRTNRGAATAPPTVPAGRCSTRPRRPMIDRCARIAKYVRAGWVICTFEYRNQLDDPANYFPMGTHPQRGFPKRIELFARLIVNVESENYLKRLVSMLNEISLRYQGYRYVSREFTGDFLRSSGEGEV